jgi:hypothetical protein
MTENNIDIIVTERNFKSCLIKLVYDFNIKSVVRLGATRYNHKYMFQLIKLFEPLGVREVRRYEYAEQKTSDRRIDALCVEVTINK